MQRAGRKVRRADVRKLRIGAPDAKLTTVGGLVSFNAFAREQGLPGELRRRFGHLKTGPGVVYPMAAQMQLCSMRPWPAPSASSTSRCSRPIRSFCTWPAAVCRASTSCTTICAASTRRPSKTSRTRRRARHRRTARAPPRPSSSLDIDTTVTPLFGEQEGARPGPNPRYHGRPSYHPILARVAQTGTILGARLRPGDTGLGELDVEDVGQWVDRARAAVGPRTLITVRIDAGGDCAPILRTIDDKGAWFLVKMKQTPNLVGAVWATKSWKTVDEDALGKPTRQVAEIDFEREGWPPGKWRVFAVRTNERLSGTRRASGRIWTSRCTCLRPTTRRTTPTRSRVATTIAPASRPSSPSSKVASASAKCPLPRLTPTKRVS